MTSTRPAPPARRRAGAGLVALLLLGSALFTSQAAARDPSVLVHCARPSVSQWYWWVDLDYLQELNEKGFEVDYTDRHQDFTWDRVSQYDVLVIYSVPLESGNYRDNTPDAPPYRDEFIEIVERFLEAGGGVFLMARSINADESFLPLIERWGARIPYELIEESDPLRVVPMPRMSGTEKLWFTDDVASTPVSDGVEQVWLPFTPHYFAAETMPIEVSSDWTVVLRGGSSSRTVPVASQKALIHRPPRARVRPGGVRAPDLFAIRQYKSGRLAFCSMWPQYSLGQGTRWLYDRRVLSRGLDGKPSHFGRLVENTLSWLGAPRLAASPQSGFVTEPARLVDPNERPGVKEEFVRTSLRGDAEGQKALERARHGTILRGLIGASTGSGGKIPEFARAAREADLDFVVFLEEYDDLDEQKLQGLRRACREQSDEDLTLIPGYRLKTNTGNRIFVFGTEIAMLPADLVEKGRLTLQYRDPLSGEYAPGSAFQTWVSRNVFSRAGVNIGYYGFEGRPRALRLDDLRLHSIVGLRLFRNGKSVEDNLPAYLQSAAGTLPAAPVAVHLLDSPSRLAEAAENGIGLTYVQTESARELLEALSYANQFKSPNVFTSDGPLIEIWPRVRQFYTFGAEDYVARAARLNVPLAVRSEAGLAEIRIYDGTRLFRRFLCHGSKRFELVLELAASSMKNLVLVAEDVDGGRAVGNAVRVWKGADTAPVFCGDRINHCSREPIMAKGPGYVQVSMTPAIEAGHTWDGGPRGEHRIMRLINAGRPGLRSSRGSEGQRGFNNLARLELADEGAVRVTARLEMLYDREIPVINPWNTYGPLEGPSHLFRSEATLTVFDRPTLGSSPDMYPGFPVKGGSEVSLFENRITFRKRQRVESLVLFRQNDYHGPYPLTLVHGRGEELLARHQFSPETRPRQGLSLRQGDWVGVFGPPPTNSSMHFNRGEPLRLEWMPGDRVSLQFLADLAGSTVRRDETHLFELLSVVDPVDAETRSVERMARIARYLIEPTGLEVLRGVRVGAAFPAGPGVLDLEVARGAAALRIPRPQVSLDVPLPVRVRGLNPRWSAGVLQVDGYVLGNYGPATGRYREAGVDSEGQAYASLFPDRAGTTEIVIGHPVICDDDALFVQVTRLDDLPAPGRWHVSLNNPTDDDISTKCRAAFDVPGLTFEERDVELPAGGYEVLVPE